jgi:hypothetical protein
MLTAARRKRTMPRRNLCRALTVLSLLAFVPSAQGQARTCVDAVRARVQCSNAEEACQRMTGSLDPQTGSNFAELFTFERRDLGDGTNAYVFAQKPGSDPYAYVASFHFMKEADRLVLFFDGQGRPVTYATNRPRVNGRYQIERTATADIPGLYRKREVETWFSTGKEYARAFSRVAIEAARDAKLNGTQILWNPEMEETYKKVGPSWTYRVESGDTLSAIAHRFGVTIDEILRQNDLRDPKSLRLGQVLHYEAWKVSAR